MAMFWQMVNDPIDFYIIGRVDAEFAGVLEAYKFRNVTVGGSFDQKDLAFMLADVDMSVHFSIWPETYCIGVDEARAAGVVPIVLGYGALGERIRDGVDGIVVEPDRPYDLIQKLRSNCVDRMPIKKTRYEISKLVDGYNNHFDALRTIYKELTQRYPTLTTANYGGAERSLILGDLGIRFNSRDWKEQAVDVDMNQETEGLLAIKAEQECEQRNLIRFNGTIPIEPVMRPGDEAILLMIDEVSCHLSSEKYIFLPKWKLSLTLGVGIENGLDRAPLDIFIVGKRIYRTAFENSRDCIGSIKWSMVLCSVADLEPDIYSVVVSIVGGQQRLYYGSGLKIVVGTSTAGVSDQVDLRSVPWELRDRDTAPIWPSRHGHRAATRVRLGIKSLIHSVTSGLKVHIDIVSGAPKEAGVSPLVRRAHNEHLTISGWIVAQHLGACFDVVFLRLTGADKAAVGRALLVERPDVAKRFGNKGFLRSGFEWSYPISQLSAGKYQVEVVGVEVDGRLQSGLAGEVIIE
jgi:hypothetical protein